MRTIVIGLGNPILGDDGVGWRAAETLRESVPPGSADFEFSSGGGLSLMELMVGYDRALILDAICTGKQPFGTFQSYDLSEMPTFAGGHLSSSHETNLETAFTLGRSLATKLPAEVRVIAVEAKSAFEFQENLSPEVERAIPRMVALGLEYLSGLSSA